MSGHAFSGSAVDAVVIGSVRHRGRIGRNGWRMDVWNEAKDSARAKLITDGGRSFRVFEGKDGEKAKLTKVGG